MKPIRMTFAWAAAVALATACAAPAPDAPRPAPGVPLYGNLGSHHHPITTQSPEAQRYFDQGLILSYAFNHAEAIRAFREAARLDPECAMCHWGVALALGPNINAPMPPDVVAEAWAALRTALDLAPRVSEREQAYIAALGRRYGPEPAADRAPLDRAYADAMREVVRRFPDDLDAAVLFAESLMDTAPWSYWNKDGSPREFTGEVLSTLESVLARHPDHPGAIHLYIHAVEASPDPGRAEAHADRLAALVPGAGHLVHMPSHIYIRVGRFSEASRANEAAIAADEAYFAGNHAPDNDTYRMGYYPHNKHFFVMSASMEGRSAEAMAAALDLRGVTHAAMFGDPAMGGMAQHFALTPLYTLVRFERWEEAMREPEPPVEFPYMRAVSHFARGLALLHAGALAAAQAELEALTALKDDARLASTYVSSVNPAVAVVPIAHGVLAGWIAAREGRTAEALRLLEAAARAEDDLTYMEPPDWPLPVRQTLGIVLLELNRPREAEAAFRADLRRFPGNGWSLAGLAESLEQQGRRQEARDVHARFAAAWSAADVALEGGRPAAAGAPVTSMPASAPHAGHGSGGS